MTRAFGVIGLGYGDEGKGTIVDYLCRQTGAKLVVRHNGGPQAAHNVVTDDGRHHTFSQFGAGTLAGARTLLSRFVAVDPVVMEVEAAHLAKLGMVHPLSTVSVDPRCLVITPLHRLMNRVREISRKNKHGSCGIGFGEAISDALAHPKEALRIVDFTLGLYLVEDKLLALSQRLCTIENRYLFATENMDFGELSIRKWVRDTARVVSLLHIASDSQIIDDEQERGGDIVFEGAQGVLLDEDHGFHPHTTWSHTDFRNVKALLNGTKTAVTRIGVTRSFATRHGAGPFVTEDETQIPLIGEHNAMHPWQENFRTGALDLVALNYATCVAGGVDQVALTHVDMIPERCQRACVSYRAPSGRTSRHVRSVSPADFDEREQLTNQLKMTKPVYENVYSEEDAIERIEDACGAKVKILSRGPRAMDKSAR